MESGAQTHRGEHYECKELQKLWMYFQLFFQIILPFFGIFVFQGQGILHPDQEIGAYGHPRAPPQRPGQEPGLVVPSGPEALPVRPRPGAAAKACEGVLQLLFPLRCPVCDGIVTPQGERLALVMAVYRRLRLKSIRGPPSSGMSTAGYSLAWDLCMVTSI